MVMCADMMLLPDAVVMSFLITSPVTYLINIGKNGSRLLD